MPPQVTREKFAQALGELGHDPAKYLGQRISIGTMATLYELEEDIIIEAIDRKMIAAHYDYSHDTIWVDALDAAHFFYCVRNEASLYSAT